MNPQPRGQLFSSPSERTLELRRTFRAPIDDVWASLTESERTSRWIGTWSGKPGPGNTIDFIMTSEGATEPSPVVITECVPPSRLALDMSGPGGIWQIRVDLHESDGVTTAVFQHALVPDDDIADIGPGWEYYFDRWMAAFTDGEMPNWDDYYPAQQEYFRGLITINR